MAFMALGVYLCYMMVSPFLSTLTWAVTLAVLFTPLQEKLEEKFKSSNVSAILSTLVISFLIIVPFLIVVQQVVMQIFYSAQWLGHILDNSDWQPLQKYPTLTQYFNNIKIYLDIPSILKEINAWLIAVSASFLKSSAINLIDIALIFYLLFFLLRDRKLALKALSTLSPLAIEDMQQLYITIKATIKAIAYGTLAIAMIQGLLGGLMFWWLDLPSPLVFGAIMTLFSLIPMLGAFIVWIPGVAYLLLIGEWGKALTLTLWGMIVIGTIDNLLRPYWVSSQINIHPLLIFFSIVGGVFLFGPAGLILGPIIFTGTRFLMNLWKTQNNQAS